MLSDDQLRHYHQVASETPTSAEHGDEIREAQWMLQRAAMTPAQLAAEEAQFRARAQRMNELAEAEAWEKQQREDDLLRRYHSRNSG